MNYLVEITKASRALDVHVLHDSLPSAMVYVAQSSVGGAGFRIFEFQPAGLGEPVGEILLRRYGRDAVEDVNHATLEEADAALLTLDGSDGYDVRDSTNQLLRRRVPLWQALYEGVIGRHNAEQIVGARSNDLGRTDEDRF